MAKISRASVGQFSFLAAWMLWVPAFIYSNVVGAIGARDPNPLADQVHRFKTATSIVYISGPEYYLFNGAMLLGAVCLLITLGVRIHERKTGSRSKSG